jgi:hypothetical protein
MLTLPISWVIGFSPDIPRRLVPPTDIPVLLERFPCSREQGSLATTR